MGDGVCLKGQTSVDCHWNTILSSIVRHPHIISATKVMLCVQSMFGWCSKPKGTLYSENQQQYVHLRKAQHPFKPVACLSWWCGTAGLRECFWNSLLLEQRHYSRSYHLRNHTTLFLKQASFGVVRRRHLSSVQLLRRPHCKLCCIHHSAAHVVDGRLAPRYRMYYFDASKLGVTRMYDLRLTAWAQHIMQMSQHY